MGDLDGGPSHPKLGGDQTIPIFAVSHRRGESIHCFVSSCGTTLDGAAHMAYFEDDEERAQIDSDDFEIARKAPKVLGSWGHG